MKTLPILFFLFLGFYSKAQESFNRFYVSANYSPDVAYRILINHDGSDISDQIIESRNNSERPKFGMTSAICLGYQPKKWLAVEVGIGYSNRGYSFGPSKLTFTDMIDPRFGFNYAGNAPNSATIKYNYAFHYLDVPVSAVFKLQFGKLTLSPRIGATLNILMHNTVTSIFDPSEGKTQRETETYDQDFHRLNVTPIVGIGLGYAVSDRLSIIASPKFKFGTMLITDAPISAYLWNAGLSLGITYGFVPKE